jgi:hypothetical protein
MKKARIGNNFAGATDTTSAGEDGAASPGNGDAAGALVGVDTVTASTTTAWFEGSIGVFHAWQPQMDTATTNKVPAANFISPPGRHLFGFDAAL